ncbi:hypothetical protein K2173_009491 [Erythroxylum novogranatense]|uniref:SLC26A/SulP transporter domain-containing protein n=1 Tax=Erythroxylum novogranatense TaxID=1862640 RepID=A0AAV8U7Z1_9ROSI|nr:hypothetical protein K2173_009491 [Erythroxylum novogranatense]
MATLLSKLDATNDLGEPEDVNEEMRIHKASPFDIKTKQDTEKVAVELLATRIICSICSKLNSGAQTRISNIIVAATVLVTLLFLVPLFHYTPNVILAAIILTDVIGLIDYEAAYKL